MFSDGKSSAPAGCLFQQLIILTIKKLCFLMYLNLSGFSFQPLILVILLSVSLIKALVLSTHGSTYALLLDLAGKLFSYFTKVFVILKNSKE